MTISTRTRNTRSDTRSSLVRFPANGIRRIGNICAMSGQDISKNADRVVGINKAIQESRQKTSNNSPPVSSIEKDKVVMHLKPVASTIEDFMNWRKNAILRLSCLTVRQIEVMELILEGFPNKIIALDLGISLRTVESHRASIMRKTGAKSLPALVRLAFTASWNGDPTQMRLE